MGTWAGKFGVIVVGVATLAVGGLVAGVSRAESPLPASAPDPTPSLDELLDVLTPEQLGCLIDGSAGPNFDPDDLDAIVELMLACDVSFEDLEPIFGDDGDSISPLSTGPQQGDDGFANIGVDAATAECVADRIALVPPSDDNSALFVLQLCQTSVLEIVTNIAVGGAKSAAVGDLA